MPTKEQLTKVIKRLNKTIEAALDQSDRYRDEHHAGCRTEEAQTLYDNCRRAVKAAKELL
jgi:hypothetical protein